MEGLFLLSPSHVRVSAPGIWLIPSCSLKSVSLPLVLGVIAAAPSCEILCHRISFVWAEQPRDEANVL